MNTKLLITKLLTILISIILIIQPLSGCITNFEQIDYERIDYKNKNLSKEQKESLQKALTVSSLIDCPVQPSKHKTHLKYR